MQSITFIGPRRKGMQDGPFYVDEVWQQRDDFDYEESALLYAEHMSKDYPPTPYRIRKYTRYAVEFVPSWHLKDADGKPTEDVAAIEAGA